MRIVLDTNVAMRAVKPGLARELVDRLIQNPHQLLVSAFCLNELSRVLQYPRVRRWHQLTDAEIADFVGELAAAATYVELPVGPSPPVVSQDRQDDPIVDTAILGAADALCTRDVHILGDPAAVAYCARHGVHVVDDITLINVLRQP